MKGTFVNHTVSNVKIDLAGCLQQMWQTDVSNVLSARLLHLVIETTNKPTSVPCAKLGYGLWYRQNYCNDGEYFKSS